jgi:thiamine-phosphate pyrophosphorylase
MAADASRAGIELLQVRERLLSVRDTTALVARVVDVTRGRSLVLVNDRFDVALAAGAAGVHLTTTSLLPSDVRACTGPGFVVAVSTHSASEVRDAERGGADFAVCGPVFETPSKRGLGEPIGLDELARATSLVRMPVLALGGVDVRSAPSVLEAGAAGFAGIRIFRDAWGDGRLPALERLVRDVKGGTSRSTPDGLTI